MVNVIQDCNLPVLRRDRAPFVFTSDMAYVINGGDKPSSRFHDFVDLCCEAYNLIRKHAHLFLNLLGLVSPQHLNEGFISFCGGVLEFHCIFSAFNRNTIRNLLFDCRCCRAGYQSCLMWMI